MVYFTKAGEEVIAVYRSQQRYLRRFRTGREDTTNNIPWKKQEEFPKSGNEGLYGFTIRHEGKIHIREDLIGDQRLETIIHESIHTPDEYETRRLTEWILLSKPERNKYSKGLKYIK